MASTHRCFQHLLLLAPLAVSILCTLSVSKFLRAGLFPGHPGSLFAWQINGTVFQPIDFLIGMICQLSSAVWTPIWGVWDFLCSALGGMPQSNFFSNNFWVTPCNPLYHLWFVNTDLINCDNSFLVQLSFKECRFCFCSDHLALKFASTESLFQLSASPRCQMNSWPMKVYSPGQQWYYWAAEAFHKQNVRCSFLSAEHVLVLSLFTYFWSFLKVHECSTKMRPRF